jgi:hypothetical protein
MLDTLNNVKSRLNITTSQYDTFLTAQITLVSDVIEAYLRRKVKSQTFHQHFYRTDYVSCLMLQLFCFPATAIATITEDGVTLSSSNYRLHKPTGRVLRLDHTGFFCADETIVTYTAGWAAVPTPILSVLDSVVQERYNKQSSGIDLNFGSDVQRISIPGSISIDFDFSLNNDKRTSYFGSILGNNLNILDQYRSERAILGSSKLVYLDEGTEGNP